MAVKKSYQFNTNVTFKCWLLMLWHRVLVTMTEKTLFFILKVTSHQIRSAWKRYGWIVLDEYTDHGWYTDFWLLSLFLKFKVSSLSGILLTWSVLHAILRFRRFRWQICMRCLILYMQIIAATILFKFEFFLVSRCHSSKWTKTHRKKLYSN